MLVVVYFCQVKQYPWLPISWMLALMCSSYCGLWVSWALLWPIRRKRGFLQGPAPVALGRNDHFPCRKFCCCLELRNARNVHNCPPFFFQTLSFMPIFSLTFLMEFVFSVGGGIVSILHTAHAHTHMYRRINIRSYWSGWLSGCFSERLLGSVDVTLIFKVTIRGWFKTDAEAVFDVSWLVSALQNLAL